MAELMEWIDADGVHHALDGSAGIRTMAGRKGLTMVSVALIEDKSPQGRGTVLRQAQYKARDVDIPLLFEGATPDDVLDLIGEFAAVCDPRRGTGLLRYTRASGRSRELVAAYIDGLDGDDTVNKLGPTWARTVATFRAPEPLWRDTSETIVSLAIATGSTPTFFPLLPLYLTPSTIVVSTSVLNDGDAETYPVWSLTGPGDTIVLENQTTGEQIVLGIVLAAGDALTIDTRPKPLRPGLAIYDGNGLSQFSTLDASSVLWTLPRGASQISVQMAGTTGASSVSMAFRRRWVAP